MPQTTCLYPENAPRTGYNKGCRCSRCVTEKSAQKRAEYQRNTETYKNYQKNYQATHPRNRSSNRKRVYAPRSGCLYPHQSPYTAWDKGCRCAECTNTRKTHEKNMRNSVIRKAKDTMRNRARTGGVPMPSTPQEIHDLLCVYIKREILNESGIRCHVDHIIPLRQGGTHTANNVRILTEKENLSRNRNPNIQCTPLDLQTTEQHHQYQETLKKLA